MSSSPQDSSTKILSLGQPAILIARNILSISIKPMNTKPLNYLIPFILLVMTNLNNGLSQELSFSKGKYLLEGKVIPLEVLRDQLDLGISQQLQLNNLIKWERTRKISGSLFLISSGTAILAYYGSIFVSERGNFVTGPIFTLSLGFIAITSGTIASINLVTWGVSSLYNSNLRKEFLHNYNSSVSTSKNLKLDLGLNASGLSLTLKF